MFDLLSAFSPSLSSLRTSHITFILFIVWSGLLRYQVVPHVASKERERESEGDREGERKRERFGGRKRERERERNGVGEKSLLARIEHMIVPQLPASSCLIS